MGELQRAHLQQNRVVRELEEAVARVPVLKKTVRNQQQVIVSLEALLRRAVAEVKELKAANTAAAVAVEAAAAARDAAEAAKSSAEISAARARAKAESAMSPAVRAGKSKAKAARVKEPEPQAAAATPSLHSLPAQAPANLPPEPVQLRSPQHTPEEVVALRKELSRVKERMEGLQQTAEEARHKEQQAVATAEAAEAASEAAGERAKQAEEAAQAADNDLLEVSSNWLSWCIGTHTQCPGEVWKGLSRKFLLTVRRAVGC